MTCRMQHGEAEYVVLNTAGEWVRVTTCKNTKAHSSVPLGGALLPWNYQSNSLKTAFLAGFVTKSRLRVHTQRWKRSSQRRGHETTHISHALNKLAKLGMTNIENCNIVLKISVLTV